MLAPNPPTSPTHRSLSMKRRLTALVLVLSLLIPAIPRAERNPVQGLQFRGRTYCTVFSINETRGYWATAAHCAVAAYQLEHEEGGELSTIDGKTATIIYIDTWTDTAVLKADAHADAYKLAKKSPEVGDYLYIIGFPYGLTRTRTEGTMAARDIPIPHPSFNIVVISDILDITVAGGNSGSPVLNKNGQVVGVLWGGFTRSPHSISVPLESIRRSIGSFFED